MGIPTLENTNRKFVKADLQAADSGGPIKNKIVKDMRHTRGLKFVRHYPLQGMAK